ncbi:hypothetical protein PAHAL_3G381600 [Panicum hallii]|uniref:Uncharacterized protein n=1 Tax=Panicum hallii TaxID=206008 RepID=A0A2T8KKS2_9POAL|nr:hypothetical protein PAHAL_3G381600 [Panicum hallii]
MKEGPRHRGVGWSGAGTRWCPAICAQAARSPRTEVKEAGLEEGGRWSCSSDFSDDIEEVQVLVQELKTCCC